jgi:hypothetical protein
VRSLLIGEQSHDINIHVASVGNIRDAKRLQKRE